MDQTATTLQSKEILTACEEGKAVHTTLLYISLLLLALSLDI